ncbi:MAG: type IX secretion system sortase PorU [Paludibacteraceae bacterium]|nr:type IX secretion system sortase PorU [Paludibacteraceae bacterium]
MKRILTTLLILTLMCTTLWAEHSYVSSSVLSDGQFVMIRIQETGMYKLTYDELKKLGLNPASVRIYGYGGARLAQDFTKKKIDDLPLVPVYQEKGADGVFGNGDYIVFFGQGIVNWEYNGSRFVHTKNCYSDYGYYFLTSQKGETQTIQMAEEETASATRVVNTYWNHQLHEKDTINLVDRTGMEGGGREFYGEQFNPGQTRKFTFTYPEGIVGDKMIAYVDLAGTGFNAEMQFITKIAGNEYTTNILGSTDHLQRATTGKLSKSVPTDYNAQQTVEIKFTGQDALGFLNYIELAAECNLKCTTGPLYFRTNLGYNNSEVLEFHVSNATSQTQIWDVTDLAHIQRVPATLNGDVLTFKANNQTIHDYVAFNPSDIKLSATAVGEVPNQNLHRLKDIDMVIITPEEFKAEAQRLADAHEQYDNMTTAVVTDKQVYNEFSSGTPDATAYRWLMKMLYDRSKKGEGQAPRYLLLFGDGTFDNRKYYIQSGNNWLLTYQAKNSVNEVKAYATDDYFAFLDDEEGENDIRGRMDISVGRLPVNTIDQSRQVVDKLIRHMGNTSRGRWKNQVLFLADDGDHNLHTMCADTAAEPIRRDMPDFIVNKVYLDSYTQVVNASSESYPLAETKMNNLLNQGVLLFDYSGHAGYNNATNEGLISVATIRKMQNQNLAFWLFATCSFALFDAGKVSAAEEAVLHPTSGALAVCSSDRTVYADRNWPLNRYVCEALFAHDDDFHYPNRIGDAVRLGKNACGSDENKLAYVLLGDPAISLHFPTQYQVKTSQMPDTLNALSVNDVHGYIETEEGDTASWFNGKLSITIFDKMQELKTLDNDEPDNSKKKIMPFNDFPNTLFQGETEVRDGKFEFQFMVPKDIRYSFGPGRLVYYAYDTETLEEAVGHYDKMIIGGSSTLEIVDTIGPELNVYLNTPSFMNGDKTHATPHFYADISDEHGINTVGSGIGHDLLLVIDGKASQTYALNEYFTAKSGSYQRGTVSYSMAELTEGMHTAQFKAWDLVNNSSSTTLSFEVVKGLAPDIVSVMAYPNPVAMGDVLHVAVDYTQPDLNMQTDLYVYDLSGRLIYHQQQQGVENLQWNINESRVPAGVYLYKVELSSVNTKAISKSGKLIITR